MFYQKFVSVYINFKYFWASASYFVTSSSSSLSSLIFFTDFLADDHFQVSTDSIKLPRHVRPSSDFDEHRANIKFMYIELVPLS